MIIFDVEAKVIEVMNDPILAPKEPMLMMASSQEASAAAADPGPGDPGPAGVRNGAAWASARHSAFPTECFTRFSRGRS